MGGPPLVVMSGIAAILSAEDKPSDARSTLAAAVIVGCVMAATVIYDLDSWSFKRQLAVHFAAMAVTVFPAMCLSGWFRTETAWDIATIGGYFLAGGLILGSVGYLIFGLVVPRIQNRVRPSANVE